jgi:mRNA interferase RelE/StbE
VDYKVYIVSPAKREIKKLPRAVQIAILSSTFSLGQDPRPKGHKPIVGQQDLLRIRAGRYRIIYSVHDRSQTVIVVTVRSRSEATYKIIPVKDLATKIKELEGLFKL